jgi:hypothetical protein
MCRQAAATIRSPAAVVVTEVDVVVVPLVPAIVDEFEASSGLAALPLYSHAVMQIVSLTLGVQVMVDSVPWLIFHQK